MIIVKLQGGLGNQMFQYALGKSLSLKKNTDLKLDISSFEKGSFRSYALLPFSISAKFAKSEEIRKFLKYRRMTGPFRYFWNFFIADWKKYADEKQFHFDPDVLTINKNAYIDGYWNTEKYFENIREILLQDFTIKTLPTEKNKEAMMLIQKTNSVSVHIRRGDYANNLVTNQTHGTLPNEYYWRACAYIAEREENPKFFVFSDDILWVRKNLKFQFETVYIDWNDSAHAFEDLRLMSFCKHHIIANSTFSWWGAWLSKNPSKIIVAPEKWFNQVKPNTDIRDIIPETWIKL